MASVVGRSSERNSATFLLAGILPLLLCDALAQDQRAVCLTSNRALGRCTLIQCCPQVYNGLDVQPLPQEMNIFLRRNRCGFQGSDNLVCCPVYEPPPTVTTLRPVAAENEVADEDGGATEDVSQHQNLRLLPQNLCGRVSTRRLYNQTRAELMELPWMALLAYTVRSGSPFKCGGTLINDRYVMTAAHCVRNRSPVSVRLGEHNLTSTRDCEYFGGEHQYCSRTPQDIPVERVIPHPCFIGMPGRQHDIALVRLSRPAYFNEAVLPICLPVTLAQQTENFVGKRLLVSGWGATENRQPTSVLGRWSVQVMSYPHCSAALDNEVPISSVSQMCTGGVRDEGQPCFPGSGATLATVKVVRVAQVVERFMQRGILSLEPEDCGSRRKPGVYTRVGHYMKWILDNIEP